MKEGQTVRFEIYDGLFKDVVIGVGVLVSRVYGRLWWIVPTEFCSSLSGGRVMIHETSIELI